jgi:hypothetical protein
MCTVFSPGKPWGKGDPGRFLGVGKALWNARKIKLIKRKINQVPPSFSPHSPREKYANHDREDPREWFSWEDA